MKMYKVGKLGAIASFLCLIALSCAGTFTSETNSTDINSNNSDEFLIYEKLMFPENSDYLIIPVGLQKPKSQSANRFFPTTEFGEYLIEAESSPRQSSSSRQSSSDKIIFYNMIFHHQKNGESHLLLPNNAMIASFNWIEFKQLINKKTVNQKLIFMEVIPETKTVSEPNDNQPRIAYIADTSGKNLTQLTPDNTKVVSWHLDKELGFILLKVLQDSDQNGEFTVKDDTSFIRVNLNDPQIGSDIITEPMRKQINQKL